MKIDTLILRLTILYLVLPYLLFCSFWLSLPFALIFGVLGLYVAYKSWISTENHSLPNHIYLGYKKHIIWSLVLLSIVLFFSGIGSFTFQNYDHLYRNAIFRDLVTKPWPVTYAIKGFGNHIFEGKNTVMTYYMGFFLPAAGLGKIFGFTAAKVFLLLWSYLGAALTFLHIGRYYKKFSLKTLALFLGWGTLFFIGSLYKYPVREILEEKSWLWAGMILYADSNIGLIYYTFNQSLTAWLIILLVQQGLFQKQIWFWYSLCFFLSPFAFIGMAPFMALDAYKRWQNHSFKNFFSLENTLGAISVLALTYIYLSSNQAGQFFQILLHRPKILIVFYLLSWVLVVALMFKTQRKNQTFWLIILILTPLPFFQQGYGIDFPGRISVPALFILMLLFGDSYLKEKNRFIKLGLVSYLILTGIGHWGLEIVRSMYFTGIEYTAYHSNLFLEDKGKETFIADDIQASRIKPYCIKDLGTLSNPKNEVIWNYMSDQQQSRYYRWLAPKP